jgi:DNA-directed RNA polymerase specialized sigma24 family protein
MPDLVAPRESAAVPLASREEEFESWLAAREATLQRTAHLLTGDAQVAQELVRDTLGRLYLTWSSAHDLGGPDAYATRILVDEHRAARRRRSRGREQRTEDSSESPESPVIHTEYDDRREALWQLVGLLPPRQRAAVVLRFYEQLTGPDLDTLRERCEEADYPSTSMAAVVDTAGVVRARRRRTSAGVIAATAAVVATVASATWLGGHVASPLAPQHSTSTQTSAGPPVPGADSRQGVPLGTTTGTDYLQGKDYRAADGTTTKLPYQPYNLQAAAYRNGFLVAHTVAHDARRLTWLDDRLRPRWTSCASDAVNLVRSYDGTHLAYATVNCTTHVTTVHLATVEGSSVRQLVDRIPDHHQISLTGATHNTVDYSYWLPPQGAQGPGFVTDFHGRDRRVPR